MFDEALYIEEMTKMIDRAISRLQSEKPDFKVYTASIWTDANAAASSINFDSKKQSLENVKKSNEWSKRYYEQYIAEGDLEQAELFRPYTGTRSCNPADFELRDFEEMTHKSFPIDWENETDGECWKELEPALIHVAELFLPRIKTMNIEEGFELSINSERDWYDKTWQ